MTTLVGRLPWHPVKSLLSWSGVAWFWIVAFLVLPNVTYSKLTGPCNPGTPCSQDVFYTHMGAAATYPLRVDASFREVHATLTNVTIVRIQP